MASVIDIRDISRVSEAGEGDALKIYTDPQVEIWVARGLQGPQDASTLSQQAARLMLDPGSPGGEHDVYLFIKLPRV